MTVSLENRYSPARGPSGISGYDLYLGPRHIPALDRRVNARKLVRRRQRHPVQDFLEQQSRFQPPMVQLDRRDLTEVQGARGAPEQGFRLP